MIKPEHNCKSHSDTLRFMETALDKKSAKGKVVTEWQAKEDELYCF